MFKKIPDISKQIYKEDIKKILVNEYSLLGPIWVNFQMEWMNGIYTTFKNHDKYLIIIYLLKKTIDFYSRSFVQLSYEEFYQRDTVAIEKFNITEISNVLNIPKESARRKINELKDLGIIKKTKKNVIIDRSCFSLVKPDNTIKRISRFLAILSKLCVDEKILSKKLTSGHLEIAIKDNFSYIWKIYYEMQIPMLLGYKKIFKDLETFHIFCSCVVNQHTNTEKYYKKKMSRKFFLAAIINEKIQGINAMSISDITGIPRATAIRKLQQLVKNQNLTIDKKKHYRLSGNFIHKLSPTQNTLLEQLANFSCQIFNYSESLSKKT